MIIQPLQPDIVKYHAKQDKAKLQTTLNANWFFSGLVVNTGLIIIIPFIETVFRIWTKGIIIFDFALFLSLAASVSVINFGAALYNYLYSINSLRSITVISIARIFTLAIFSFYLSGILGLAGIGVAVLLSEIVSSIMLPYYFANKLFKTFEGRLSIHTILLALIAPIIMTALVVLEFAGIEFSYLLWGIALFIITLVYIFNWSILEEEIKIRFKGLFSNMMSNSR